MLPDALVAIAAALLLAALVVLTAHRYLEGAEAELRRRPLRPWAIGTTVGAAAWFAVGRVVVWLAPGAVDLVAAVALVVCGAAVVVTAVDVRRRLRALRAARGR